MEPLQQVFLNRTRYKCDRAGYLGQENGTLPAVGSKSVRICIADGIATSIRIEIDPARQPDGILGQDDPILVSRRDLLCYFRALR